jgi:hypothetical protein
MYAGGIRNRKSERATTMRTARRSYIFLSERGTRVPER